MTASWALVRVKRRWVPEKLWERLCWLRLPVTHWPLRQILTREATAFEKMRAHGYKRKRTLFETQMWGDGDE